jgi:hypothetical protein
MACDQFYGVFARIFGPLFIFYFYGLAISVRSALAISVPVENSSLIDILHYSDTFRLTAYGGNAGRSEGAYPVGAPGINLENNYGNPAVAWTNSKWSLNSDSSPFPGTPAYPGPSGGGSDTGITQTGMFGGFAHFGIEYGLSDSYVVQFDVAQTSDFVSITSDTLRDTFTGGADIPGQRSLSVFFRGDSHSLASIGIYSPYALETDSGLALGGTGVNVGEWVNYAVRFDRANNEIEIYVNEISQGILDLTTFAGGVYADWSNAAVNVGGLGGQILWTDNFQVGAFVPEPDSFLLVGLAVIGCSIVGVRKSILSTTRGEVWQNAKA